MTPAEATAAGKRGEELRRELDRLGIAAVPLTVFEWGGYRYGNARDAIAAARRAAR
ncbi:MAG TPA: hypothetical protein VFK58_07180 [Sphingomicrobium sp.]|nr:hypothetical protein [Sphingomicrobium sp.]